MKNFASSERCTTYFRDYAVNQIRVAYRLMEYLNPDDVFKPHQKSEKIVKMFLNNEVSEAVHEIIYNECCIDISSSRGSEDFELEAYVLACDLLEQFKQKNQSDLIRKREELRKELESVDKEIFNTNE